MFASPIDNLNLEDGTTSRHVRLAGRLWTLGLILILTVAYSRAAIGQPVERVPADPAASEEAREQRAMERYLSLVEKNPRHSTALDRFHVVKLFNEKLSDLRRELYREATEVQHKAVLKGTRWLLLKNAEDLDEEKDEKGRLKEALKLNESLAVTYYLKEDLRRFWEQPGKRFATTFLDGWIRRAEASGIEVLRQMAKALAAHRSGLLAYYDVMISSGPMEGTNHKIKTMKRQTHEFRDREFFKLKILAIHETKYALVG